MRYITKYGPWIAASFALAFLIYVGITVYNYRPPDEFTMATGREGGAYYAFGLEYQQLLEEQGYTLNLIPTAGSKENLRLLEEGKVDVALVQAGTASAEHADTLKSLGSLFYEPLWIFYRMDAEGAPFDRVTELGGHRIAVGEKEGGTYDIALRILELNGIDASDSTLLPLPNQEAAAQLKAGDIDVMFMIASPESDVVMDLLVNSDIEVLSIERTHAYKSRYSEISTIILGEGSIDLANNIPDEDKTMLTTVAAFVSPHDLSPDLARLLLTVAEEVHGSGGILEDRGEFPSNKLVQLPMDVAAEGYLETGPTGLDRFFPLWMASRLERTLFLVVPFLVLLYPLFRTTPFAVSFFFSFRINRWYRRLRMIELHMNDMTVEELEEQIVWLDELEKDLAKRLGVPMMYLADVYMLRFQVGQVNHRLEKRQEDLISGAAKIGEESPDEDETMDSDTDTIGLSSMQNLGEELPKQPDPGPA